jgi:hypothetical protein
MNTARQNLLERLRRELQFVNNGGYRQYPRSMWRAPYIFEDSPSCPNSSDPARSHSCEECWLIEFVPHDLREEQVPCRFVDLTGNGVTVDSLYRCGTPLESEEALRNWLELRIHELESELSEASQLPFSAEAGAHRG